LKPKLENKSHQEAIAIYNIFIEKFQKKEQDYTGKKKILASYIRVTFEIFKIERQVYQNLDLDNEELKKGIILLEKKLLESSYELEKIKQTF